MKNNKGFTLIELLVVVLIIGILAAIALPQYFKAVARSRSSDALTTIKAVMGAQQRFHLASPTSWPASFADLDIEFDGASGATYTNNATGFQYDIANTPTITGANAGVGVTFTGHADTGVINCADTSGKGICTNLPGVTVAP